MQYPNDAGSSQSSRGTGLGWDPELNTITDEAGRLEELYRENPDYKKVVQSGLQRFDLFTQMFSRNIATGGLARSSSQQRRTVYNSNNVDDEEMDDTHSGTRRSRDEYEDTIFSQSQPMTSGEEFFSSPGSAPVFAGPSGNGRRSRCATSELHAKKCETMDRFNESLQGKIDRTGPKATESIERCVDEFYKDSGSAGYYIHHRVRALSQSQHMHDLFTS
ncbi:UNVERIFIED_CONTAM: hypothetical protein Sindi_1267100 [Sesamum indicum]